MGRAILSAVGALVSFAALAFVGGLFVALAAGALVGKAAAVVCVVAGVGEAFASYRFAIGERDHAAGLRAMREGR